MEVEKVKKILGSYRRLLRMARELDRQAKELGDRAETMGSKKISDMPRGGCRATMEDLLAEKADTEKRRDAFLKRAENAKEEVQQYIDMVDSTQHNRLLYKLYIKEMSVEEIADVEGYSKRQEWRIYKEAHEKVRNAMSVECQ